MIERCTTMLKLGCRSRLRIELRRISLWIELYAKAVHIQRPNHTKGAFCGKYEVLFIHYLCGKYGVLFINLVYKQNFVFATKSSLCVIGPLYVYCFRIQLYPKANSSELYASLVKSVNACRLEKRYNSHHRRRAAHLVKA